MTIPEAITTLTDAVDDVYWRDEYQAITEDDAFLQRIVKAADLPSLLVALAAVTGDFEILRPALRPPFPPADVVPAPQGGLTVEAQAEARELALSALKRVRDDRLNKPRRLDATQTRVLLDFLTNGASDTDTELLTHELDLAPKKLGAPDWTFEGVAQGRDFRVAVIGTGMSGIAAMYRLSQAGVPFTAFEKNSEVGGVWWANTYPGVRLDTPTFAYSYSFAQRTDWPSAYARGEEIEEYALEIVDRAGLREHVVFDTEVTALTWDEQRGDWEVRTRSSSGTEVVHYFNAVISAVGQLERPNIPDYPGRGDFHGTQMHSARWDHGVDLAGKRVAVIGTGASAYQIVPAIVDSVAQLTVFQRSGPWMIPAPNYHDRTPSALSWLCEHVPYYGQWFRLSGFFQSATGRAHTVIAAPGWEREDSVSPVNLKVRQILTDIISRQWKDHPELVATVVPNYPPGGKRMLRDNGVWAEALQQPHTRIVTSGIDHFTENGIATADGEVHEFDAVIYATGFQASDFLDQIEVRGATGETLKRHWDGDARAWAGISVPGYPNLFMIMGPNTNYVVHGSQHFMMECAVEFAVEAIHQILLRGVKGFSVTRPALDDFVAKVDSANATRAWGQPQVCSWYKNRHGRVSQIWPFSHIEYWQLTHEVDFDRDFTVHH